MKADKDIKETALGYFESVTVRDGFMAQQLTEAEAGINSDDAVFTGIGHRNLATMMAASGIEVAWVDSVSPLYEQINAMLAFYQNNPEELNPEEFLSLWMIERMSQVFEHLPNPAIDQAILRQIYKHATKTKLLRLPGRKPQNGVSLHTLSNILSN